MATSYLAPGIYVEELATGARVIEAVGTSTAGFVGVAPASDVRPNTLVACTSWSAFTSVFAPPGSQSTPLSHAVFGFFNNGGSYCYVVNIGAAGSLATGLKVLEQTDDISIVGTPGFADPDSYDLLLSHAENRKDRFAILDTPPDVTSIETLTRAATAGPTPAPGTGPRRDTSAASDTGAATAGPQPGTRPRTSTGGYGAVYFPRILVADPLAQAASGQPRPRVYVAPTGHMAGVYARSDSMRGVHKAPANETLRGVLGVERFLTRDEQAVLNPAGVNAVRFFAAEGIKV